MIGEDFQQNYNGLRKWADASGIHAVVRRCLSLNVDVWLWMCYSLCAVSSHHLVFSENCSPFQETLERLKEVQSEMNSFKKLFVLVQQKPGALCLSSMSVQDENICHHLTTRTAPIIWSYLLILLAALLLVFRRKIHCFTQQHESLKLTLRSCVACCEIEKVEEGGVTNIASWTFVCIYDIQLSQHITAISKPVLLLKYHHVKTGVIFTALSSCCFF